MSMTLLRMCLNQTCGRFMVGKYSSGVFFYSGCFATRRLEHAIRKVYENRERLKWSGEYQLLVCADGVNLLCEKNNTKKNTKQLVAASTEVGLKVNAEKTKYASMSGERNADMITTYGR